MDHQLNNIDNEEVEMLNARSVMSVLASRNSGTMGVFVLYIRND